MTDEEHSFENLVELAERRFPGLARWLEAGVDEIYSVLGSHTPGEAEVEGPERLQEYYGFSDDIMEWLKLYVPEDQDLIMGPPSMMLKVLGDLFYWAAAGRRSKARRAHARLTSRTAVYGPVRTVVWEGWSREAPPYPDSSVLKFGIRLVFTNCTIIN